MPGVGGSKQSGPPMPSGRRDRRRTWDRQFSRMPGQGRGWPLAGRRWGDSRTDPDRPSILDLRGFLPGWSGRGPRRRGAAALWPAGIPALREWGPGVVRNPGAGGPTNRGSWEPWASGVSPRGSGVLMEGRALALMLRGATVPGDLGAKVRRSLQGGGPNAPKGPRAPGHPGAGVTHRPRSGTRFLINPRGAGAPRRPGFVDTASLWRLCFFAGLEG